MSFMTRKLKTAILGASGYTGADAVRLALRHPHVELVALTANTHAGKPMGEVFEHFRGMDLPMLTTLEETDWAHNAGDHQGHPPGQSGLRGRRHVCRFSAARHCHL
jgi:N-acetyl-gamma-glutamyl-phosphate reductase